MELIDGTLLISEFFTVTLGIVVLFVGKRLNDAIPFLREYSIPEPVTGGLLFSVLFALVYARARAEAGAMPAWARRRFTSSSSSSWASSSSLVKKFFLVFGVSRAPHWQPRPSISWPLWRQ